MTTYTSSAGQTGVTPKGIRVGLTGVSVALEASIICPTSGTILEMVKVPKGSRVLFMSYGATGTDWDFEIGDSVSSSRYKSAGVLSGALGMIMAKTLNQNYTYSAEDKILITSSLCSDGSGAGTVYLNVVFGLDTGA